jgi:hypothetical protein
VALLQLFEPQIIADGRSLESLQSEKPRFSSRDSLFVGNPEPAHYQEFAMKAKLPQKEEAKPLSVHFELVVLLLQSIASRF